MTSARWQRVGGSFGIAFVVLIVLTAFVLAPNAPVSTASANDVTAWVMARRDSLGLANYLGALSTVFLVIFATGLRSRLVGMQQDNDELANISFGASLLLAGLLLVAGFVEVGITQRAPENRDVSLATLNLIASAASPLFYFPIVLIVGAASAAALTTRRLPRSIAGLGCLVGIVGLLAGLAAAVRSGPLALDGPVVTLSLPLFLLWILATSMALLLAPPPSRPT